MLDENRAPGEGANCWIIRTVQKIGTHALALIFATLPPASQKSIFQAWIGDIMGDDKLVGQLAVDGKALRATAKGRGANAVHMFNVWSTEQGMCVGQQKVADKSNKITAIPELLQLLELKGCLVSIDAMGTQVEIADTILKKSGDYLLLNR